MNLDQIYGMADTKYYIRQHSGTLVLEIHGDSATRVLRFNPQHGYFEEFGRRVTALTRDVVAFLQQSAPWTASRYA